MQQGAKSLIVRFRHTQFVSMLTNCALTIRQASRKMGPKTPEQSLSPHQNDFAVAVIFDSERRRRTTKRGRFQFRLNQEKMSVRGKFSEVPNVDQLSLHIE